MRRGGEAAAARSRTPEDRTCSDTGRSASAALVNWTEVKSSCFERYWMNIEVGDCVDLLLLLLSMVDKVVVDHVAVTVDVSIIIVFRLVVVVIVVVHQEQRQASIGFLLNN
jgi:hypothetical protein